MDDKNVEDFFAKKDKGKKGKKSKFTGTRDRESIAKSFDESKQAGKDKVKEKQTANSQSASEKGEDEWKDFEEPTQKDYTGLKIQSLQISDKQDTESAGSGEDEYDEEGDVVSKKDNPWSASQGAKAPTEPAPVEHRQVVGGVYRPPSFNRAPLPRRGPKAVPEIGSEIAFPSLQAAGQTEKKKEFQNSGRSFETVMHGSRSSSADIMSNRGPRLDLGNKFDALSNS